MISRSTVRRRRFAATGVLVGMVAALALGTGAQAAPSPSAPAPTPTAKVAAGPSISISGPKLQHALTFRKDRQPVQYGELLAEVAWMDDRAADVIKNTTVNLGPHYVVVAQTGSKVTGRYDLYPDVAGGPRTHRQALSSSKEAWFYAPVDMAAKLAALGVAMPTTAATDAVFAQPTVAATPLQHSLSAIAKESVTALVLAALGCVAILILLGFAARRSHAVDRRRTLPPAMSRLASVKAKASAGKGAMLRGAMPNRGRAAATSSGPGAPRTPAGAARAPGTPANRGATGLVARQASSAPSAVLTPQTGAAAAKRAMQAKLAVANSRGAADDGDSTVGKRPGWRGILPTLASQLPRPRRTVPVPIEGSAETAAATVVPEPAVSTGAAAPTAPAAPPSPTEPSAEPAAPSAPQQPSAPAAASLPTAPATPSAAPTEPTAPSAAPSED